MPSLDTDTGMTPASEADTGMTPATEDSGSQYSSGLVSHHFDKFAEFHMVLYDAFGAILRDPLQHNTVLHKNWLMWHQTGYNRESTFAIVCQAMKLKPQSMHTLFIFLKTFTVLEKYLDYHYEATTQSIQYQKVLPSPIGPPSDSELHILCSVWQCLMESWGSHSSSARD